MPNNEHDELIWHTVHPCKINRLADIITNQTNNDKLTWVSASNTDHWLSVNLPLEFKIEINKAFCLASKKHPPTVVIYMAGSVALYEVLEFENEAITAMCQAAREQYFKTNQVLDMLIKEVEEIGNYILGDDKK